MITTTEMFVWLMVTGLCGAVVVRTLDGDPLISGTLSIASALSALVAGILIGMLGAPLVVRIATFGLALLMASLGVLTLMGY